MRCDRIVDGSCAELLKLGRHAFQRVLVPRLIGLCATSEEAYGADGRQKAPLNRVREHDWGTSLEAENLRGHRWWYLSCGGQTIRLTERVRSLQSSTPHERESALLLPIVLGWKA